MHRTLEMDAARPAPDCELDGSGSQAFAGLAPLGRAGADFAGLDAAELCAVLAAAPFFAALVDETGRPVEALATRAWASGSSEGRFSRFLRNPETLRRFAEANAALLGSTLPDYTAMADIEDGDLVWTQASMTRLSTGRRLFTAIASPILPRCCSEVCRLSLLRDPLTGLPDRLVFRDRVSDALSQRNPAQGVPVVLAVRLERVDDLSETLGRRWSDALLKAASERVASLLGPGDLLSREMGDLFTILVEGVCDPRTVVRLARAIREVSLTPLVVGEAGVTAPMWIGAAFASPHTNSAEELLGQAFQALNRARTKSRKGFKIYKNSMERRARELIRLETDLPKAITRGEIHLEYQPIVSTAAGDWLGMEALARWRHPKLGSVSPLVFIEAAEQSGLIEPLGRFVLTQALDFLIQARFDQGPPPGLRERFTLSVNLSAKQLDKEHLFRDIEAALEHSGADPSRLVLEVTESAIIENPTRTALVLNRIKSLGVRLAVDDFGVGFSSPAHLHRFPFDVIKIDKSFVQALGEGERPEIVLRSLVRLGADLGMDVVVEGVETAEQAQTVRSLGSYAAQGWWFSKAVPPDRVLLGPGA